MSSNLPQATSSSASSSTHQDGRPWHSVVPSLPPQPGVYWFLDTSNTVLYVGKAKNLKKRVTSYTQEKRLSNRIRQMVCTAQTLQFQVLNNELEALLTEAELIRTYQPDYNVLLKDDKSPLYIVITQEPYPKVLQVRKQVLDQKSVSKKTVFGPFTSAYQVKQVLNLARRIFPWCNSQDFNKKKACFYYHLDLCPGACLGEISHEKYAENIEQLTLFLRGKTKEVITELTKLMKESVAKEEFEAAAEYRDLIAAVTKVTSPSYRLQPQLTHLTKDLGTDGGVYLSRLLRTVTGLPREYSIERVEGYDVSNIQGTNATVAQVVFLNGQKAAQEYRLFNIRSLQTPNDYAMLQEALTRRQNHSEWGTPNLIMIDGGKGQLRAVLKVWNWPIPVISLAKDPDRIIIPHISSRDWGKGVPEKLEYSELRLEPDHPALLLLQRIRDEAHRFSKKQHTLLRTKALIAE